MHHSNISICLPLASWETPMKWLWVYLRYPTSILNNIPLGLAKQLTRASTIREMTKNISCDGKFNHVFNRKENKCKKGVVIRKYKWLIFKLNLWTEYSVSWWRKLHNTSYVSTHRHYISIWIQNYHAAIGKKGGGGVGVLRNGLGRQLFTFNCSPHSIITMTPCIP